MDMDKLRRAVRDILEAVGEDPEDVRGDILRAGLRP